MWLLYAALAAVSFGLRGILYHWTSQKPINRNLMLFGVFSTGAIISLLMSLISQQQWTIHILIGVLMGLFSFAANGSMYKGFTVGKASLVAILTGLPPVVVVILAYALWGETLTLWQLATFIIIVAGILILRYSSDLSLKQLKGVQWGLLTMLFFALNDLSGKQAMRLDAAIFPTLFMMFITGSICFGGLWLMGRVKAKKNALGTEENSLKERPWKPSKTFLWGMLVGITNASGMILILPAFKLGVTGLVSAVTATNVLLILLYSRVFLKEIFSRREFTGICLALAGVILLRLLG
ncbi:MAG: DMT family transporter [Paenibacillaceae bacterium]